MDEQLQNKIALALDKMMNGAPEVWQGLILEVQTRGAVMAGIGVMSVILGIMLIRKAIKVNKWDDESMVYLIPGITVAVVGTIAGLTNLYNLLAPSLTLLNTLS